MFNRFSALCAGLLLAGAVFAAPARPLVVAQSIDLSGPNGSIGRDYVAGITTYFDSINMKGGVNGRRISFIVRDDHGVPSESAANISALIKEERADYLLGALGAEANQAIVAAPAFASSGHLLFAPLADSAAAPHARLMYWRPGIESEYLFLLNYFGNLGIKEIGIALQDSPQNARSLKLLTDEMRKRSMTLSGVARIGGSAAMVQQQAQMLSKSGAKLVIAIADTVASAQFLRAFRQQAPAVFVAGTSLTNLATLREIAGANATDWTVFSQVVPDPATTGSQLQADHIKMMKLLRDEPVSSVTLEGFAVAKTLVNMIQDGAPGHPRSLALAAGKPPLDLGGMTIGGRDGRKSLSAYVGIALLKRSGGLMF